MNESISTSIAAAAVISFLINWLKKSEHIPWVTAETAKLNRLLAIAFSGLASLGVHLKFDHAAGSLLITGLTLSTVLYGLWHWLAQFAITHGWFKATSSSDELLSLLKSYLASQIAKEPGK